MHGGRWYKNKIQTENDPFVRIQVYVPKSIFGILEEQSEKHGLPISRLACIAIDNELDAPAPFNYLCLMPTNTYIEGAYIEEAQKLSRFLMKFPNGTGRDTLMLCRRDVGVLDRGTFMLAYRELMEVGIIEEVKVPLRAKFNYGVNYLYTKLKNLSHSKPSIRKQKKLRQLQKEMIEEQEFKKKYGVEEK